MARSLTRGASAWLRVGRDDPGEPEAAEVQPELVVVVLPQQLAVHLGAGDGESVVYGNVRGIR